MNDICRRIRNELRYTQSADYAFTKLESWIGELKNVARGENFLDLGTQLIECVKEELLPIMANYSFEEVEAMLKSPRFRTLALLRSKILELAKASEKHKAKPITRERYPLPPTAKEQTYRTLVNERKVFRRYGLFRNWRYELRSAVTLLMLFMFITVIITVLLLR